MAVNRDAVARHANVSPAVVSYVINDGPRPVAPKSRERVLAAIAELGYRPHRAAQQLAMGGKKTQTLGLIVGSLDEYMAEVAELFTTAAAERGYQVFLATSGHDVDRERAHLIDMAERRVDGVVVLPVQPTPENLAFADSLGLPVLTLDRPEIASLRTLAATNHLIEHGHTRIAIITGNRGRIGSQRRVENWRRALLEAGLAADATLIQHAENSRAGGYRAAAELFGLDDPPSGLVVYTDARALGALRAAADRGLAIPEDLALISTQGSASMAYTVPSMSVVAQPVGALAHGALEAILELAQDADATVTNLDYEVIGRESCGCTAPRVQVLHP